MAEDRGNKVFWEANAGELKSLNIRSKKTELPLLGDEVKEVLVSTEPRILTPKQRKRH